MYISEETVKILKNDLLRADKAFFDGNYEEGSCILNECITMLRCVAIEDDSKRQAVVNWYRERT